jgi:hypothetical protein
LVVSQEFGTGAAAWFYNSGLRLLRHVRRIFDSTGLI